MYAYRPQFEKKKEKLLSLSLALVGVVLYGSSQIPGAPFPGLIQILGIAFLAVAILLISMCIMRRYDYVLEADENGKTDFIITEYYGRRTMVVCRVRLSDVCSVLPITKDTEEQRKALKKEGTHYSYTGVLFDEKRYLVEMNAHGEHVFVTICADERLVEFLSCH